MTSSSGYPTNVQQALHFKLARHVQESDVFMQDPKMFNEKSKKIFDETTKIRLGTLIQLDCAHYNEAQTVSGFAGTALNSVVSQQTKNITYPVVLGEFKTITQVQISNNDITGAETTYAKAADIVLANKDAKEEDIAKLANSYVKVLVKQNKNTDAIKVLLGLIEKFDKLALSQERYLLGDLLFKNGDIKKAETAWGKIPENEDAIWKKLAQEKLKQASWDVNYKKHLKRIPAMSKLEDGK